MLIAMVVLKLGIWDSSHFCNLNIYDFSLCFYDSSMTLGIESTDLSPTNILYSTMDNNGVGGQINGDASNGDVSTNGDTGTFEYSDHFSERPGPAVLPTICDLEAHGFSDEEVSRSYDKAIINEGEPSNVTEAKNDFNSTIDAAAESIGREISNHQERVAAFSGLSGQELEDAYMRSARFADANIANEMEYIARHKIDLIATIVDPSANPFVPDTEGHLPSDSD
jgi:hypothetical protein